MEARPPPGSASAFLGQEFFGPAVRPDQNRGRDDIRDGRMRGDDRQHAAGKRTRRVPGRRLATTSNPFILQLEARTLPLKNEHIEQRDGIYYVRGTKITLDSIVYGFRQGDSAETLREDFEGLSLAHVYGAIAFYLDHQATIDTYLADRRQRWADLERGATPPDADLALRLTKAKSRPATGLLAR